jgi:hypothetical protein
MPRRHSSQAIAVQPEEARETSGGVSKRRRSVAPATKLRRLTKRSVQKTDGRYLIYYEKA